jgi:predicted esterase YcpF (UPF0227 family)
MNEPMILYLHGFRSSPLSFKAQLIRERLLRSGVNATYHCPQLPASPREAIEMATRIIGSCPPAQLALIGSSLGGYYATWLAERFDCRAVLLNPAIRPPRELEKHVGVTTAYHSNQPFEFKREYVDELHALEVQRITRPERYFLIAATGDEVLDWREMIQHYPDARQHVIDGSDHGLSNFEVYLDEVLEFCGVPAVRPTGLGQR